MSIPSLVVSVAGLWPQIVAGTLARQQQRYGPLDDARSVSGSGARTRTRLLRLSDHRGFLDGALHLPGLARHLPALCRIDAEARPGRPRSISRPGHRASRADTDPVGYGVPALLAGAADELARSRYRGAGRMELRHQQQ